MLLITAIPVAINPDRFLEQLKLPKVRGWIRVYPYLRVDGMSELLRYMVVLIHPANSSASKSAILYILAV